MGSAISGFAAPTFSVLLNISENGVKVGTPGIVQASINANSLSTGEVVIENLIALG